MKNQKQQRLSQTTNHFDLLSEEIVFTILDFFGENPIDKKSFSLTCKSFYVIESKHRKNLRPLRQEPLSGILTRYPNITHLDLSLCPRVTDSSLTTISKLCESTLRSIDLSRSGAFSGSGLLRLAVNCRNLVEIDVSNATNLKDAGAAALAEAKNLEKLWMGRCKFVTDMGVGCIAVGCKNLKLISLKWCLGVGDFGVGLIAVKCKEIRSLDLSYLPITDKCLPSILKLQHLEDLVLEGCFGIDDDSLAVAALKHGCKSLKALDMSSCQNISHLGLASLTSGTGGLQQLTLAYGSPVTLALADGLKKLSMLQSIKLDGCVVTCAGLKAIGNLCVSLKELSLSKCLGVIDEGLKSISRCPNLSVLKLGICLNITDEGLIHVGMGCPKLVELDLYRSVEITDSGVSAIASGCPDMEMVNIAYCLAAIAVGCRQLAKLDIKKCHNVDDVGMLPLAHFSQNLRQINLSYSSVTDVGLLSLASISCLQSLTILHVKGLTPSGLAAALLACRGLTKVKLQASFKYLLPQPLFEYIEARGCVLQWRDKVFQAELDPKCWKLQLEDMVP
ncbi:hypothetical protein LWI29_023955 [Acer saccharum]|uniref:F-box/LRR-repeat protein 15-like leucin rich repeat domain-containing protein n=1 Tax=Acer saccharum TaxID=4024 RepID=A0AA39VP77_ACESA|nr:hypothetical protein LWI29_023955 [Acer saccharum]